MRLIRGFITIIGIIGILVVIALVIGYFLFSLTPPIQSKMTEPTVSSEAAESLAQKLEAFDKEIEDAVSNGKKVKVNLTITEKEINSKFVEALAEGELPLNEIKINFRENRFLVYAVADVPGVAAKTGTIGRIDVEDGNPKIVVEDFDLGKLPLPQVADRGVEKTLDIMLKLRLTELPVEIKDVEISGRRLTVTGVTKTTD